MDIIETDKKKILIISRSFYPQNSPRSFRATELAVELARIGHEVTVYIPTEGRDYTSFEITHCLKVKNIGALKWRQIELKGGHFEQLLRRITKRALMLLFEWPDIELMFRASKALQYVNGYDLLISIAVPYPIHWGVAKARTGANRLAKTWIADCGDPYMGDSADSFRKLFYFKYIEKWFCRKADYITVPFEGARSAYYPEFRDKIRVIPQGFRLDTVEIPEYKKQFDYPVFAYAGGFIPGKRDPGKLLDFLSTCDRNFKFIVYTSQANLLTPYKEVLKEKLDIRGKIPREDLLNVLAGVDFLLNLDNNTHTQLPSKLIDYAITGRPVLNLTSTPDFTALLEFMDGNYDRRVLMESLANYDIRIVAGKFLGLINN